MKNTDSARRAVVKGLLHPGLPVFIFCLFLRLALSLRLGLRRNQVRLETRWQLRRLQQLGVGLAVDDFDVGYSALSYLKNFPIGLRKTDRSFIAQVTERRDHATITSVVINLARNLGIQVVAEGVETISQLRFLRQYGCHAAQGYLISRPAPTDPLKQWLMPQHAGNSF